MLLFEGENHRRSSRSWRTQYDWHAARDRVCRDYGRGTCIIVLELYFEFVDVQLRTPTHRPAVAVIVVVVVVLC